MGGTPGKYQCLGPTNRDADLKCPGRLLTAVTEEEMLSWVMWKGSRMGRPRGIRQRQGLSEEALTRSIELGCKQGQEVH